MANPNPEIWGAPESWIQSQYLPAVEVSDSSLKAMKARIANFDSNTGTLSAGDTAGKTPINQSLDATICPCGQDPLISPFAKISIFKNHQSDELNKVPEQVIINEETCNWFLYEGTGGSLYTDHVSETGAAWRWLPDATITNNMDGRVQPYVFWQLKSLLIYVSLYYVSSYYSDTPQYSEMTLAEWAANPTRKVADIKLTFLGVDSANESGTMYKTGSAAQMSDGRWGGVGYIGKLYNNIERYIMYVYNRQLTFDVFGHLKGNSYASSPFFAMNSADMFEDVELKAKYVPNQTQYGWDIWYEIPYSEENYNKVLSIAALFGCPFTASSTKRTFDAAFTDDDLYLPVLDSRGIAHGEYTHGAANVNNSLYSVDSVRDIGYDPYAPEPEPPGPDPPEPPELEAPNIYCLNCGLGGESRIFNGEPICPRCHATGAYLIEIPALAQGPMWEINPDDPEYGSIYELDMERDQDSGFTNPNLHRRTSDAPEGTYEVINYPEGLPVSVSDFQIGTPNGTPTITKYTGASKSVRIPEAFVDAGYTTLGGEMFTGSGVTYVEIPDGVTTIE